MPKMSALSWHLRKSNGITKVSKIHPLGTMNVHPLTVEILKWWTDGLPAEKPG